MTTVADLVAMDRRALAALWSDLFHGPLPKSISQVMMRRFLAYELQARARGDLAPAQARRLDAVATAKSRPQARRLRPGGRLLREWNGVTHVVEVIEDGFLWNGARHASLSAIARAITGARWSGPRFFGLIERRPA